MYQTFGREEMLQIAIEEWIGRQPDLHQADAEALKFEGDDVITIFKGMQLDIGAPPQFMDFRYTVHDRWHGEFHLDHCGALMDVEPMGEDYVAACATTSRIPRSTPPRRPPTGPRFGRSTVRRGYPPIGPRTAHGP